MMQYAILWEVDGGISAWNAVKELEQSVNEYIKRGWEPIGGICCDGNKVFQAMIKRV